MIRTAIDATLRDERGTLLGLYHGYDQARVLLGRLVARYGSCPPEASKTQRELWSRARRSGFAEDLFEPFGLPGAPEDVHRGAHSAALAAFATVSEKAEELLRILTDRWPELREEAGGPLPSPWDEDAA